MANGPETLEYQRTSDGDNGDTSTGDILQLTLRRRVYSAKTFTDDFPPLFSAKKASNFSRITRTLRPTKCSWHDVKLFVFRIVPILQWLPEYQKSLLLEDVVAGLTVGILRIPHGMAHAVLATLSPVYGLYTNIFPQLIYTLFGTSRHISIGTMAVISIMVGDAVEKAYKSLYGEKGSLDRPIDEDHEAHERARIASTLALMVGAIQLVMGLLRFGVITNYLPEPLVRGFTTGATCHVFCSQFNILFGIELLRYTGPFSLIKSYIPFFTSLGSVNTTTLLISIICLVILISVKEIQDIIRERFRWPIPVEMLVVVLGTLFSHLFDFDEQKVITVGNIPNGFPRPYIPSFSYASTLLPDAIILSIVSYALCISLANIFAKKHHYEVKANQELFAFGIAHSLSSLMYCYPSTSSLSRTLVRDIGGGKTMVAGFVSTTLVIFVVMVIGQYMSTLPTCCLAAIIVVAVRGMLRQVTDIKVLSRYSRMDMTIWVVTCLSTVLLGLDYGLAIGMAFSVFSIVLRSQRPHCHTLGQFEETGLYGNIETFADAKVIPGVKIVRIQSPIYFANASYIKKRLRVPEPRVSEGMDEEIHCNNHNMAQQLYDEQSQPNIGFNDTHQSVDSAFVEGQSSEGSRSDSIHTLILDMGAVTFVDTVGLNTIESISQDHHAAGVKVHLAECRRNVQEMMFDSGLVKSIDTDQIFMSVHDAVLYSQGKQPQISASSCPTTEDQRETSV